MSVKPKSEIERELFKARQARALGLEGKARVCARRAAGWAAQSYLESLSKESLHDTAFSALRALMTLPGLSRQTLLQLEHLTMRVDEAYHLPAEIDLLLDAEKLIQFLQEGKLT